MVQKVVLFYVYDQNKFKFLVIHCFFYSAIQTGKW